MKIMIIGAGGHGQVVADILLAMQQDGSEVNPIGFLDDDSTLKGQYLLDLPVLGGLADLPNIDHDAVIIGIGGNSTRRNLFEKLRSQGEIFVTALHPRAVIARKVSIGEGSVICAGVVVNTGTEIGVNIILNTGCTVDHHNQIGDHAHIAPGVHLGGDVQIGQGTLVGIGATVMPQRSVGSWSVVGAASMVRHRLPDHVKAAGVPARVFGQIK